MPSELILFGAAHVDRLARSSGPFVLEASNPGRVRESVGGAAFNAAAALAAFGADAVLVGARAGDAAGELVSEALSRLGITDAGITWLDRRTPSYTAILDDLGNLVAAIADMELYDLLAPRSLTRRHIRERLDAAAAILVDANLPEASIRMIAEGAGERPVAAIGVSPAKVTRLRPAAATLGALFLSRLEAARLAGTTDDADALESLAILAATGVRRAVVTDGPRAAAILDHGEISVQVPATVERVLDVTGAGDTLAGIALLALCEGRPFVEAARLGMAAAAWKISAPDFGRDCRAASERIAAAMPAPRPMSRR